MNELSLKDLLMSLRGKVSAEKIRAKTWHIPEEIC